MRDIVCTSRDGERFWKIPECYVRGNSIKYLRLPDEAAHNTPRAINVGDVEVEPSQVEAI